MIGIVLCAMVFLAALVAGRRSLVRGIVVVLGAGYAYGITRANVTDIGGYFFFDAAIVGFFLARLSVGWTAEQRARIGPLKGWIACLLIWPTLLLIVPSQEYLIQLVGLRGNALLVPFVLIGAALDGDERYRLALWLGALNLVAFAFAVAEFTMGVEAFFPPSAVTELIYQSNDVAGYTAFRIPATFGSAHAYAGTMVITLAFLLGAWVQSPRRRAHQWLLALAIPASLVGVFMAGARVHALVAFLVAAVATFALPGAGSRRVGWLAVASAVAWVISAEERLQRFTTIWETDVVTERIAWSVNMTFFDIVRDFPFGNGLGGGGTSIPYFLQERINYPVLLENEYSRILLELGLPGLALWLVFFVWLFTRHTAVEPGWRLGRRLAWFCSAAYVGTALIGTGLLTSIPHTCLLLMSIGWIGARYVPSSDRTAVAVRQPAIR